jgi:hypothetical protein
MDSNHRRRSRRFYRTLSLCTSQNAADQRICAARRDSGFPMPPCPRNPRNSRGPRTAWAGAVMLTVRPLHCRAAGRTLRRAGVPDARPANKPQPITSSTRQRQRLSHCSRRRPPRRARSRSGRCWLSFRISAQAIQIRLFWASWASLASAAHPCSAGHVRGHEKVPHVTRLRSPVIAR